MDRCKVLLSIALLCGGCSVAQLSRQATRGAIDESTAQLAQGDTPQALQQAARDPQLQGAAQDLSGAVAEGILQALESDRAQKRVSDLTRIVTQAAAQQMIDALASDKTRAQLELLARGATDAALKQSAETLQSDLGPAIKHLLERDMAEGMANALGSDPMQKAIARESQTFAHNAVLGWNSGFRTAWQGPDGALHDARGSSMIVLVLALLGLAALIVVSFAVMTVARARQARSEVARLESATLLLATAMREKQETQQTDEILAVVQHALEGRAERTGKYRILDALRMRKSG
ncbi:MAG: hypothetical protein ABW352_16895 [Polyangiales bacterium]